VLEADISGAQLTFDHSALEGTKRIRPDAVGAFGSIAEHFAFRREGGR
jgi:hypothetical protein